MSIGAELMQAEQMVVDLECYVATAVWHPGRNCRALLEIREVDRLLQRVSKSPASEFPAVYMERMGQIFSLRVRWAAVKDKLPENPWAMASTILACGTDQE
jgi:hypothetical protein